MEFTYTVNDVPIRMQVDGDVLVGPDKVLLDLDDDLTAGTEWHDAGFVVRPFLESSQYSSIASEIERLISGLLDRFGVDTCGFRLDQYHRYCSQHAEIHGKVVSAIRSCFPLRMFPIDVRVVEDRVGDICGVGVRAMNVAYGLNEFCVRIVRPQSKDNNPLHRDVWLDRLRSAVNIYVPLAGSNDRSSLCIVPGSHLWRESEIERTAEGARVDGSAYTVPAVVGASRPLSVLRPDPGRNQVLVFSPYLIHGGAVNLNDDTTRVSLEMRFWRASDGATATPLPLT